MAMVTVLPLYLRVIEGASFASIGLLMIPYLGAIGVGSICVGQLVRRTGSTMIFPSVGLIVVAALLACPGRIVELSGPVNAAVYFGVVGVFMGTTLGVIQVTAQSVAGPGLQGITAAAMQLSRSLGSGIGVALASAVLYRELDRNGNCARETFGSLLAHNLGSSDNHSISLSMPVFQTAFGHVFLLIALMAVCASAFAWLVPMRNI